MDALTLIIFGLATWRISNLLVREDGPFFSFKHLREMAGIIHDQDGGIFMVPDRFMPGILACVWCSSIWVGAGWLIFWFFLPKIAVLVATVFCLSALAISFDRFFGSKNP